MQRGGFRPRMRAALLLAFVLVAFAAPVASAGNPGCDETFSHPEVCYAYQDLDAARACVKNLRWCIIGPI